MAFDSFLKNRFSTLNKGQSGERQRLAQTFQQKTYGKNFVALEYTL